MELSQVKAAVKSWEKSFRSKNGRDPTKDDIKRDPGDIAEQYALYRRLSKTSSSQSQSQSQGQSSSRNHNSQSQSLQVPPSSTSASTSSSQSRPLRSTPRTIPSSEYPTTPTPPSRKSSGPYPYSQNHSAGPSRFPERTSSTAEVGTPKRSLKRTASKAALRSSPPPTSDVPPVPSSKTLFSTPKKAAYSGPVYDPNPVNPFATSSPTRKSPSKSKNSSSSRFHELSESLAPSSSSPFIHASSPKKLKEVLEANSLRKVKERERVGLEITPRTRARKRLRGETVEDTPLKEKLPRRRRGEGSIVTRETSGSHLNVPPSGSAFPFEHDEDDDEEDEEEDELGPSPLKVVNGNGKSFSSLFAETEARQNANSSDENAGHSRGLTNTNGNGANGDPEKHSPTNVGDDDIRRGRPSEMIGLFGQVRKAEKIKEKATTKIANGFNSEKGISTEIKSQDVQITDARSSSPTPAPKIMIDEPLSELDEEDAAVVGPSISGRATSDSPGRLPTPPPDPDVEAAASQPTPSRAQRRSKVLSLSEDEEDEWDPEGGKMKRQVLIVPTRRAARRSRDSDSVVGSDNEDTLSVVEDSDGEEYRSPSPSLAEEGTTHSSTLPSPTSSLAPPMLSMLSLNSPQAPRPRSKKKIELEALRVRAIFDPAEAAKLRALKRGQEVVFSGEAGQAERGEEEEEDLLERYDAGLRDDEDAVAGEEGDDDWESESDGWKRTAEGMDDEAW